MKNKNIWGFIIVALIVGGFVWAFSEKRKRILLEEQLNEKEENYLVLLSEYLKHKKDIPENIKNQIIKLRDEYSGINETIASELKSIFKLIEQENETLAIQRLALIIENLLKERYIAEGKAENKNKCPAFGKLLEFAQNYKWIKSSHFNISIFVKDKRNQITHELNPDINNNEKIIAFFSCLEIIYHLKGIKAA